MLSSKKGVKPCDSVSIAMILHVDMCGDKLAEM